MSERIDAPTRDGQLRALFNAVCDLPVDLRTKRLAELSDDASLRNEVLALIDTQTEAFETALLPLHDLAAQLDSEELAVGDRIGHWTLTERLGRGGMGSVFVAVRDDGLFRQRVALKILRRPADVEAASQLHAERALLAGLIHPGIARLYDGGTTPGGQPFLVMEYVDGLPLDGWLRVAAPSLLERLALFDRLCEAVSYAHGQLVVHCDLKPANILVRSDAQPMLLDFGIARWIGSDGGFGKVLRDGGGGYCTPAYASPEQLAGKRPGVATDVFALGVLLAELLADASMRRNAHTATEAPLRPSQFAAGNALAWRRRLEGDLDAIVSKATALDVRKRYPNVAALRNDLARYNAHLPISARPIGLPHHTLLFLRRYRRGTMTAILLALLVTGFTLELIRERDRAREAAATAEQVSQFMVSVFDAANVRRDGGQRDLRARDVLQNGAQRIEKYLVDQPGVQARLLLAIGSAYVSLGQPAEAMPLLAKAVTLTEGSDDDYRVAIDALEHLSVVAGNEGKGEEAVAFAQRAADLRSERGDDSAEGRAESLNHIGLALRVVHRYDDARRALVESLRLRRTLGPDAEDGVVSVLNNLGMLERFDNQPEAAERYYREAIALARAHGAAGESSLENALLGLGRALSQQRRFEEAQPALQESYGLALRLYGEFSAKAATVLADLAFLHWDTGDLAAAEPLLQRNLEITRATSAADTMTMAISMNNLGLLLDERGDAASALPLLKGSLAIRRQHLPADDPALRRGTFNVARVELAQGRVAEARDLTAAYLEDLLAHPDKRKNEWWAQVLLGLEIAWRSGEAPAKVMDTLSAFWVPADDARVDAIRWRLPRLQARLLAADGRHVPAQRMIENALAAARDGGSPLDIASTALVAAQIALDSGNREAARVYLAMTQPVFDAVLVDSAPQRRQAAALAERLLR